MPALPEALRAPPPEGIPRGGRRRRSRRREKGPPVFAGSEGRGAGGRRGRRKPGPARAEKGAGWIELIIGPMYSGKTTELSRRIKRYTHADKRAVLVKSALDKRFSEGGAVVTHDGQAYPSLVKESLLPAFSELVSNYDVVGIDEGQFFPDVAEFAEAAANAGKIVVVAALDGDFRRNPFGEIRASSRLPKT